MRWCSSSSGSVLVALSLAASACFNPKGSSGASTTDDDTTTNPNPTSTGPTTTTSPSPDTSDTADTTLTTEATDTALITSSSGPDMTSTTAPASCGNGVIDSGEECDDGNHDNTDDCAACQPATCGDGFVHSGVEECDDGDGNGDDKPCRGCVKNTCGDNILCPTCGEECEGGPGCKGCKVAYRYVFVTKEAWTGGELGGLDGADEKCMDAAKAADALAGGTFRAWLSTSLVDATSRIGMSTVSYQLLDGTVVANDTADLLEGGLIVPINIDQNTKPVFEPVRVWTGTLDNGTKAANEHLCIDWTQQLGYGRFGDLSSELLWTNGGLFECTQDARLYCFQVAP